MSDFIWHASISRLVFCIYIRSSHSRYVCIHVSGVGSMSLFINSGFQDLSRGTFITCPPSPFWGTTYAWAFHHEVIFSKVLILFWSTLCEQFFHMLLFTARWSPMPQKAVPMLGLCLTYFILHEAEPRSLCSARRTYILYFERWIPMWPSLEYLFALEMLPLFLSETLIPLSSPKLTNLSWPNPLRLSVGSSELTPGALQW